VSSAYLQSRLVGEIRFRSEAVKTYPTCMQNLTILASAVPEISLGLQFHVPLRVICHPPYTVDIAYLCTKLDHSIAAAVPEI